MNTVQLVGRLTRDPEVRYSDSGSSVARFNLACDRRFKRDGEDTADFIPCTAFGKTAEFVEKWFRKGQRMGLTGRIQTGSYTNKDNVKVYTMDVIVDGVEFVESGRNAGDNEASSRPDSRNTAGDGFVNIPDDVEDAGLPFN